METFALRPLQAKDTPLVLECMTDPSIARLFRYDAGQITADTVAVFIEAAKNTQKNIHLACVDEADTYLGTISLKNIDLENKTAEYAVVFRTAAQGTGAAAFATREILRIAFTEYALARVYLNVLEDNARAWRFYEKMGFVYEGNLRKGLLLRIYHNKRLNTSFTGITT